VVDAVRIEELRDIAMATIAARRGVEVAAIGAAIGLAMPDDRRWTSGEAAVLMASGPGVWLARQHDAPPTWCGDLERRLFGLAGVSDQTGAYRLFHLEGPGARTVLQRGAAIDLHDSAFPAGAVAVTAIAHIDVIIRCLEAGRVYEAAVYRSFAESFLRWLDDTVVGLPSHSVSA